MTLKRKILVTGATGFVGRSICARILHEGWSVIGALRTLSNTSKLPAGVDAVHVGPIGPATTWTQALTGVDTVVHLAARTHIMHEVDVNPIEAYRLINVAGTERLAREASVTGVKRFIFLSSVKVNGEGREEPYTEMDAPAPEDAYGASKWEAEQVLRRVETETGMQVVIIRPPLVYGPGVKANFLNLMKAVNRRIPLPLAGIRNRRSLVYLDNLIDAIITCITRPEAAGQTYLVSDSEYISTPDLIRRIGAALERKVYLLPVPLRLMRVAGKLTGKTNSVDRLLGSLTVDAAKIRRELNWIPPYSMGQGLRKTAEWFKQHF